AQAHAASAAGRALIETIISQDASIRDRSLRRLVADRPVAEVLRACDELEAFRQSATNLYERGRASMFLHALYRYGVQDSREVADTGLIPFGAFKDLMERRFEQAISGFRSAAKAEGPSGPLASALADAYEELSYQTLADQVRRSVRSCQGN